MAKKDSHQPRPKRPIQSTSSRHVVSPPQAPGSAPTREEHEFDRALAEARASEANLRKVIDTIPAMAWCALPDGTKEFLNKQWHDYIGMPAEQSDGWGWQNCVHPDDLDRFMRAWHAMMASGEPRETELRLRRYDGKYRWFLVRGQPLRDDQGTIVRWYGTTTDIEDRKRTELLRAAEMQTLRMITDGAGLKDILNHVCTSIDLQIAPSIATILLMDPDGKRLWPSAGSRVPHDWTHAITPLPVSLDAGLCGTAAFLKTRVIIPDFTAESTCPKDLRDAALKNGIRAGWSQPILTNDRQVLGTFAIYSAESRVPTGEDLALIDAAQRIALIAIERQGSQEALRTALAETRKSEEELRRITDIIPETIIVLNPDGKADYANRVALEFTGLSLDQVRAHDFRARVFHPDDVQRVFDERRKGLAGNVPFENEQRALGKDGRYRWFLVRYNPFLDESGKVIRWYAAGTDIEDRKRVEEQRRLEQDELRAKHELLELAQRAARAMAFDWYIQAAVNTWSAEQEALYGLSPGTFDGKYESWKKLIHPDDWPCVVKAVRHSHETGHISAEFRVVWPNGSVHWLSARGQMFMDGEGRPYRMVGFTADITQRKLAEEALRRSEGYLAEAQRLTRSASWAWDVRTRETFWSQEMFRLVGYDPDKVKPSMDLFLDRVHPDDRRILAQRIRVEVRQQDRADSGTDYRIVLPDGTVKHMHSVSHRVTSAAGEITEIIGTTMDVTEQHNARAALELAFDEIKILKDRLHEENIALREDIARSSMFEEIVGSSPALNKVLAQVEKVASTDSTVLILGETGTGKELIARAIHSRSKRASRAFATVNCAAIPPSLIASELFGHEKGAFTGAMQRQLGRFESADGGTIFLDEIGELPPETQVALLRVLQERQFERLGGHQPISVDVRVLAATNRDLVAAVSQGTFRQDLFYRLNVFPIEVPALRERTGDIPLLVEYLVERYAHKAGKKIRNISKKTLDLFQTYSWPGNIRELQNVVERAVILCEGETFSVDASWLAAGPAGSVPTTAPLASDLAKREKTIIENALREAQGQISGPAGAAAKLGLPRQTLESKIKRLGIKRHRFKTS